MKISRSATVLLFLGLALVPSCLAQTLAPTAGSTWQTLFDGRDTSHWTAGVGQPFPSSEWNVDAGCLHATRTTQHSLFSQRQYRDFELVFVWRIPPMGNSGVKYLAVPGRVNEEFWKTLRQGLTMVVPLGLGALVVFFICWRELWFARQLWGRRVGYLVAGLMALAPPVFFASSWNAYQRFMQHPLGFEYQMIDDEGYIYQGGKLRPNQLTAGLYDLLAPHRAQPKPMGEFNESRILVDGNHVEHWLNGEKVVEYELGSTALRAAVAASKFASIDGFAEKNTGYLELQAHKSEVWFREIRIRELNR